MHQSYRRAFPQKYSRTLYPSQPSLLGQSDLEPTASMSWDHLTPDPSPLFEDNLDDLAIPQFFSPHNKDLTQSSNSLPFTVNANRIAENLQLCEALEKQYALRPYNSIQLNCSTRTAANLNPAIEYETDQATNTTLDCTQFENTGKRQDVELKRTNIANKIKEFDNIK